MILSDDKRNRLRHISIIQNDQTDSCVCCSTTRLHDDAHDAPADDDAEPADLPAAATHEEQQYVL